ncbi:hypothetical protein GCM10023221_15500 [Luteimicrobium xylanilyticum]|uniref:Uncharacterized protein n=1 Tax=Luteimicrobium xylanilyticum TaxID=1133546 RepID=A0A5P9QI49_9MICO|nr:hypothetical protein [Luteimicrobium xylanilyticum]QFV00146.1 hypothetical protein KDY119_03681 [Luteimicrobium xylanilyticum]
MAATKEHERRLTLRLSEHELDELHRAADANGTSLQMYVLGLVHKDLRRREDQQPTLNSWEAIRSLQQRMANGTASKAEREAFYAGFDGYELTDEDREWLDADLGGVGSDPEHDEDFR